MMPLRRIATAVLAAVLFAAAAAADAASDAVAVVSSLSGALSADNLAAFMKPIDPALPGYAKVRDQVQNLIARAQVSSSIDLLENEGDDAKRTLSLDWYIEIRSREIGQKTEPRRRTVRCVMTKSARGWRVVDLDLAGLLD